MKANELMNNDLCRYYGYICRFEINNNGVKFRNLQNDNEYHVCTIVEPIRLTKEILKNNGFHKDKLSDYETLFYVEKNNEFLYVRYIGISDFGVGNSFDEEGELQEFATINYVHELQHALRLCGMIELADSFIV